MSIPDTQLANIPEQGAPPQTRLTDAKSANAIVEKLIKDDNEASRNRTEVQRMLDGAPPYSDAKLQELGQGHRCNLNFGEGAAIIEQALAGYYDLVDSVDVMARLYTDAGDPQIRQEWESIMAEELHFTITNEPSFEHKFQELCLKFVRDGVGMAYFPDELDWRWNVAGLDTFKVPRGVSTDERDSPVAVALSDLDVSVLYKMIEDEEAAKVRGWNVAEVRRALTNATTGSPVANTTWEELQAQFKANAVYLDTVSQKVQLAHLWVKEFSGRVSHYITLRNGTNEDFLFKGAERFGGIDECFVYFTYGVGTNGQLHSIRGLGAKIFPMVQTSNRLRCNTVDGATLASSVLLKPTDETAMQDMAFVNFGAFMLMPRNVEVSSASIPNLASNAMTVVGDLTRLMQNNTGQYASRAITPDGGERTKFEVQAQLTQDSVLSTSAVNLFYRPWKRLLTEQVYRFTNPNLMEGDPGSEQVFAWRSRCIARGVPEEALFSISRVEPVRAIGYGSPGMRLSALDEFMQLFGTLDDIGKNNLLRDRFAGRIGYAQVDRYVPRLQQGVREPIDNKLATMETALLLDGNAIPVSTNDNHLLHARVHLPVVAQKLQSFGEDEIPEEEDIMGFQYAIEHIGQHMDAASAGPKGMNLNEQEIADLNTGLSQVAGLFRNVAVQFQAAQEQQGPNGDPKMAEKMNARMMETQAKIQLMQMQAQAKMQINMANAEQKRAIRDADAAAKMRMKATENALKQNL